MGTHRKASAQNRQERAGPYVPTTMRWSPRHIDQIEDLIAHYANERGEPFNRTTLLKLLVELEHRRCFPSQYGHDQRPAPATRPGKPVPKRKLPTHRRKPAPEQTGQE